MVGFNRNRWSVWSVIRSKDQRFRWKKKGFANFVFIRWDCQAFVLQSPGGVRDDIVYYDVFHDLTKRPIEVRVSQNMSLLVGRYGRNGGVSVKMSRDTYRDIRAGLMEAASSGDKNRCVREFNKLNGLPAWHGILEQKARLADYLVKKARGHQMKLSKKDLRIYTRRKVYTVWKDR